MSSTDQAADVQAAFCAAVVDEWARAGVTDAVVAPGSRSTPMVLALDAHPALRVHVVLDERAAAFTALGLGLASGRPGVVATTSGTASVEIHPALVEAHHAGVPLIAATTDRPPELHRVGAAQTVEQDQLFAGLTRWSAAPGVPDPAAAAGWRSLASRAVAEATAGPGGPGPVHLNLAFREPLIGRPEAAAVPPGRPGGHPWHHADSPAHRAPSAADVEWLAARAGRRGLVVAGTGAAESAEQAATIIEAATRLGWPVLADPRSGCRLPVPGVVAAADAILRHQGPAAPPPDLVVQIGAPWASKVLDQWLASLTDTEHALVDPWGRWGDPGRRAGRIIAAHPHVLLAQAAPTDPTAPGTWSDQWTRSEAAAQSVLDEVLGKNQPLALSEPAVARTTLAAVPAGGRLVVASSMPVRDVEWYGAPRDGVTVLANRGANGIDGTLATAIGVALAERRPVAALVGDLAFLYDAGALLWAGRRDLSLSVVVVDNDGGGIFSFLPQASALPAAQFEAYWGTPHGVDLVEVARAYGAAAEAVCSRDGLDRFLAGMGSPGLRVAVVPSDRAANVDAHNQIHAAVGAALDAVAGAG